MSGKPNSPTCARKRAYDKRGAISEANRWWRLNRKALSIYPCGDHWHLTSKQAKRRPKIKHGKM